MACIQIGYNFRSNFLNILKKNTLENEKFHIQNKRK